MCSGRQNQRSFAPKSLTFSSLVTRMLTSHVTGYAKKISIVNRLVIKNSIFGESYVVVTVV